MTFRGDGAEEEGKSKKWHPRALERERLSKVGLPFLLMTDLHDKLNFCVHAGLLSTISDQLRLIEDPDMVEKTLGILQALLVRPKEGLVTSLTTLRTGVID